MTAKKTATKRRTSTKPKPAKKAKPDTKRLSALDAAAKVLAGSEEPMTTSQMIEAMTEEGSLGQPKGQDAARHAV